MKNIIFQCIVFCFLTLSSNTVFNMNSKNITPKQEPLNTTNMKLGAFSVSLSVKDLNISKTFYESLGFEVMAGSMDKNYLIMKSETSLIGLFQGMFEGNIMTFNPGWDQSAQEIESYDDVRAIQKHLKTEGIELITEADESSSGPASFMVKDPDGNMIFVDQHR